MMHAFRNVLVIYITQLYHKIVITVLWKLELVVKQIVNLNA